MTINYNVYLKQRFHSFVPMASCNNGLKTYFKSFIYKLLLSIILDFKLILWSRFVIGWRFHTRYLIGWERHLDSISCNPRVRESMNREGFCLELDVEAVVNREIARRLSLDSVVSQLGFQISFLKFLWFSYVCYHYF